MDRRNFLQSSVVSAAASLGALSTNLFADYTEAADLPQQQKLIKEKSMSQKILIAADPFAVTLKDTLAEHLKMKGFEVVDLGATKDKEIPYYDSAPVVCRAIQKGEVDRAILLCGSGMGMSVIANRFKGVVASVVESVFAAKMSRAINNANVLCLGAMIWGDWMAKEAVDIFLETKFTEGLDGIADFLKNAEKIVEKIRD